MAILDDAALEHQRCAELCTHILILNRPIREAAKACGLKTSVARDLIASDTYQRMRQDTLTRLGVIEEAWHDKALKRIRALADKSIDVFADRMNDDANPMAQLRAAENIADRAGLERKSSAEVKHIVTLDEETVDRLTRAMRESDAIDVTNVSASLADFDYARQRPVTTPLRDSPSERTDARGVSPKGQDLDLLHGQGDPRVRRPDPRLPRRDGELDSGEVEEEARLSPA